MSEETLNYITKLKGWVELELVEEIQTKSLVLEQYSGSQLQKMGLCWLGLICSEKKIGLGGKVIMTLSLNGDIKLPPTQLKVGDIVSVISSNQPKKDKSKDENNGGGGGVIIKLTNNSVTVALDDDVEGESGTFKVIQLANDVTYKRMLRILNDMSNSLVGKDEFWPGDSNLIEYLINPTMQDDIQFGKDIKFFNENLNQSQKEAVNMALNIDKVGLIHGPPGTGKTYTLVELIRQLVKDGKRVLVCGPSNVSVDNLLERLVPTGLKCLRIGHPARIQLPHLLNYSLDLQLKYGESGQLVLDVQNDMTNLLIKLSKTKNKSQRHLLYNELKDLRKELRVRESKALKELLNNAQVIISTLNGCGGRVLNQQKFDVVVIDEASQGLEPECWLGISKSDKVIFAGDHHQLPPTVKSENTGLQHTLFKKLIQYYQSNSNHYKMLKIQYRMNEEIMLFSSTQLYRNQLKAHDSVKNHLLLDLNHIKESDETCLPLIYLDTSDNDLLEQEITNNKSLEGTKLNEGEFQLVLSHLKLLLSTDLLPSEIAIISPYSGQVNLIKSNLADLYPDLEIGTVDGFQGREKEAIILTLVRSNKEKVVGFLNDYRRLNVALTRAKRHLCIIGDGSTLFFINKTKDTKNIDFKADKDDLINQDRFLIDLGVYLNDKAEVRVPDMYQI